MSARPGQIQIVPAVGAQALGSASGKTFSLLNGSVACLNAVVITWVATATVGNRVPTLRVLSSSGQVLWQAAGGNITAGQTITLGAGAGCAALGSLISLPTEMTIPLNASIQIFDGAAAPIDNADTVALVSAVLAL